MLAEAGNVDADAPRRDPEEAAIELLQTNSARDASTAEFGASMPAAHAAFFFSRSTSTGSTTVATAVTSQTTTVAAIHDPMPRMLSPLDSSDARSSATRSTPTRCRPGKPTRTGWPS